MVNCLSFSIEKIGVPHGQGSTTAGASLLEVFVIASQPSCETEARRSRRKELWRMLSLASLKGKSYRKPRVLSDLVSLTKQNKIITSTLDQKGSLPCVSSKCKTATI